MAEQNGRDCKALLTSSQHVYFSDHGTGNGGVKATATWANPAVFIAALVFLVTVIGATGIGMSGRSLHTMIPPAPPAPSSDSPCGGGGSCGTVIIKVRQSKNAKRHNEGARLT